MTTTDELAALQAELTRRKEEAERTALQAELAKRKVFAHVRSVYPGPEGDHKCDLLQRTVYDNKWMPDKAKRGITPKQAEFLSYEGRECLYGGAAGGGKSWAALMGATQFVEDPGYHALILRRTYKQLAKADSILNVSKEWFHGKAKWNGDTYTWTFPSGATIEFGHMEGPNDHLNYQGAVFQYCSATGTKILMADGSYRAVETLKPGEMVQTLVGPRPLTRVASRGVRDCVTVRAGDAEITVTKDHRLLTDCGWVVPSGLTPTGCHACDNTSAWLKRTSPTDCTPLVYSPPGLPPVSSRLPRHRDGSRHPASDVWSAGGQTSAEASCDEHPAATPPLRSCVRLVLHGPSLRQSVPDGDDAPLRRVQDRVLDGQAHQGYQDGYPSCGGSCGEQPHRPAKDGQEHTPSLNGVEEQHPPRSRSDDPDCTQERIRMDEYSFLHPYTKEPVVASCGVALSSLPEMVQAGEREVWDLTVAGASHYISFGGIVSQNCCYDELTQFADESQYTFLFTRMRRPVSSSIPIRMRATSNPGGPGHSWCLNRFINPESKRPDAHFIPAKLTDNPNLDQAEYMEGMAAVDPLLRRRMLDGDWSAVEGGRYKPEWLRKYWRYDDAGHIVLKDDRGEYKFPLASARKFVSCDPASSSKRTADYTVFCVWYATPRGDLIWLDCIRRQVDIPEQQKLLSEVFAKHNFHFIGIEAVASNQSMFQFAERLGMQPARLSPKGQDKLAHAQAAIIAASNGRIWLPEPGVVKGFPHADIEAELTSFTGTSDDQNDDICDAVSYGVDMQKRIGHQFVKQERPGWYDPRTAPRKIVR